MTFKMNLQCLQTKPKIVYVYNNNVINCWYVGLHNYANFFLYIKASKRYT